MNHESGSFLMETLIAMPLLIALVFGVLQLAHIHIARQVVSYAAYAAARATLPAADGKEEEAARKAAQRILCWLTTVADGMQSGVLMPDPESKSVTGPSGKRRRKRTGAMSVMLCLPPGG